MSIVQLDRCKTPACHNPRNPSAGLWGNHCTTCSAILTRIREELDAEAKAKCPSTRNGLKRVQTRPVCCTPGCHEPRRPGEAYCVVCQACGAAEDEAA